MSTRRISRAALVLGLGLSALSAMGHAQGLPALEDDVAAQFQAVGRLGARDLTIRQGCSATLIAPNLIVTAAHCASPTGRSGKRFYAGWDNGAFIDQTGTTLELRHPAYGVTGQHSPRHDVALIVLDRAMTEVDPIPLSAPEFNINIFGDVAVVGYHRNVPDALSGSLTCPAEETEDPLALMLIDCPVVNGNSGSPVLARNESGAWEVIAIVSSQIGERAIAVPIPRWLRDQAAEYRTD